MFSFVKAMSDSSPSASSTGKPPPMTTHNTFGSQELFEAWAKDSFINQSTIDILVKTHEIDCLPAVLALKKEDFPDLNLPVGQRRLLENAVEKLRQECELVQPPTPKAKINLEMPSYKSMLEIGEPFDEEEVLRHSGAFQRKSTSVHDFRGRDIGQKILEHAKSHTKTEKDEDNYGPEKEALLLSQKRKSSPQMQSGLKTDGSLSPKNFDEDSDNEESTACACQRWLFVTVFMPLFLVLSILGFLLLMILAPFRVCCPKGGVYSNTVTFLFEVFLMAPCVACKWASGKRKRNSALGKPRYGGTNDVELGNK